MSGKLTVFTGPMFSGKTEELLRALRRATIAELGVQVFVPSKDTRNGEGKVISHSEVDLENYVGTAATAIANTRDLAARVRPTTRVVGIDEAQFFDTAAFGYRDEPYAGSLFDIICEIEKILAVGKHVYVAGLDMDYRIRPFGPMPHLLARADEVVKCKAVCVRCKKNASRTLRLSPDRDQVVVGGKDIYQARCADCWRVDFV